MWYYKWVVPFSFLNAPFPINTIINRISILGFIEFIGLKSKAEKEKQFLRSYSQRGLN